MGTFIRKWRHKETGLSTWMLEWWVWTVMRNMVGQRVCVVKFREVQETLSRACLLGFFWWPFIFGDKDVPSLWGYGAHASSRLTWGFYDLFSGGKNGRKVLCSNFFYLKDSICHDDIFWGSVSWTPPLVLVIWIWFRWVWGWEKKEGQRIWQSRTEVRRWREPGMEFKEVLLLGSQGKAGYWERVPPSILASLPHPRPAQRSGMNWLVRREWEDPPDWEWKLQALPGTDSWALVFSCWRKTHSQTIYIGQGHSVVLMDQERNRAIS